MKRRRRSRFLAQAPLSICPCNPACSVPVDRFSSWPTFRALAAFAIGFLFLALAHAQCWAQSQEPADPQAKDTLESKVPDIGQAEGRKSLKTDQPKWWKGNLHTHSLWSDGDQFPEMISAWYADQGYHFLALSDHNVLSRGQRWMSLDQIVKRSDDGVLDRYRQRFSDDWVETRQNKQGATEVRLKPLGEFRCLVERAGEFILIEGEEISDRAEGKPVHMNATNLRERIEPAGGKSVREVIQNNLRAVMQQQLEQGQEMLPHVNHPNFGYAITAEDLAHVIQEQFFEVYNGHPGVNQLGDDTHIPIERMWDVANTIRLATLNAEPLLGIATDDSHEYHGRPGSRPGRGWVMVRSKFLTPEHLIQAMKRGDFYASSGVQLDDVRFDRATGELKIAIHPQQAGSFKTDFIASLKPSDDQAPGPEDIGKVVDTQSGLSPTYRVRGNELYIRALITSDQPPTDPSFKGQLQQAWTQPISLIEQAHNATSAASDNTPAGDEPK